MVFCAEGHSYVEQNGLCMICGPRKAAEESERIDREREQRQVRLFTMLFESCKILNLTL